MKDPAQVGTAWISGPEAGARGLSKGTAADGQFWRATPVIPDYEMLRIIGQGAYGEVWLARNVLDGFRAVKVVRRKDLLGEDRPFEREFEGIKRFEPVSRSHPSQMAIFHVGRNASAGYFYYVMELADAAQGPTNGNRNSTRKDTSPVSAGAGQSRSFTPDMERYEPLTLRRLMRDRGALSAHECIEIGRSLGGALAHLHSQGLIHRDVKPSNVILVNGVPKLADIGLVSGLDESQSFVGTEGYIPPEGPSTPSADCYALGKLLYELSTGHDRNSWPDPAPDLATRLDRERLLELNVIIHRACAPEPRGRYQDAGAMFAELEMLCGGHSIKRKRKRERLWSVSKKVGLLAAALAIAGPLVSRLASSDHSSYVQSTNPEVNILVRQGFEAGRGGSMDRIRYAKLCFSNALRLDPIFLPAHFGLADASFRVDDPRDTNSDFQRSTKVLMRLAPNSSEAVQNEAMLKWLERRYQDGLKLMEEATRRRALCEQGSAYSHLGYGYFLQCTGDAERARAQYKIAESISAPDPIFQDHIGQTYLMQSNYSEAARYLQKSLDQEPRHFLGHRFTARLYEARNEFGKAIDELETADRLTDQYTEEEKSFYDQLRRGLKEKGATGYWETFLGRDLKSGRLYLIASRYAALGRMELAYDYLEKAGRARDYDLEAMLYDLCWDRTNPRFQAVARQAGLLK